GRIEALVPDVRVLQEAVPEESRADGELTAVATLGGTVEAPVVDVVATSPVVRVAGEAFEAVNLEGRVTADGVETFSLTLRQQEEGRLNAKGRYGFDRSFEADLEATGMTWSGIIA